MYLKILFPLALIAATGCTSFNTRIMQRSTDSRFYANCPADKTKGLPVKLKVPTHVQVNIVESFFIGSKTNSDKSVSFFEAGMELEGKPIRALQIQTQLVYTDKVFTVDFKRPAGGILALTSTKFDDEQYFQAFAANYEEQTLQQVNQALKTLQTGTPGTVSSTAGAVAPTVAQTTPQSTTDTTKSPADTTTVANTKGGLRTVAMARFDISDPNWEAQLQCFVERHVTSCYGACDDNQ